MEVKLSYFDQDGKLRASGRFVAQPSDYDHLAQDVERRARLRNGLPGVRGHADSYHILIEPAGHEPRLLLARHPKRRPTITDNPTWTVGRSGVSTPGSMFADDD